MLHVIQPKKGIVKTQIQVFRIKSRIFLLYIILPFQVHDEILDKKKQNHKAKTGYLRALETRSEWDQL